MLLFIRNWKVKKNSIQLDKIPVYSTKIKTSQKNVMVKRKYWHFELALIAELWFWISTLKLQAFFKYGNKKKVLFLSHAKRHLTLGAKYLRNWAARFASAPIFSLYHHRPMTQTIESGARPWIVDPSLFLWFRRYYFFLLDIRHESWSTSSRCGEHRTLA